MAQIQDNENMLLNSLNGTRCRSVVQHRSGLVFTAAADYPTFFRCLEAPCSRSTGTCLRLPRQADSSQWSGPTCRGRRQLSVLPLSSHSDSHVTPLAS